jgi:hypothetical protein
MTQPMRVVTRSLTPFGAIVLLSSCIDLSKQAVCPVPTGEGAVKVCAAGFRPSDDGLIDDFEDGDSQLSRVADRGGYWFTSHDPNGSVIDPTPFKISDADAGSKKALRVFGRTSSDAGAWGVVFGASFVEQGAYDASDYAGISFKAKVAGDSTKSVRFNIADANTHPDGGICKSCWNHFGKDVELSNDWREYVLLFGEAKQQAGWGDPVPALTPSKLIALSWAVGTGKQFDVWIDDIQFVVCK